MDEFHFYAEPQRGWAWQVPLLTLPQAQFLLMSATLGDTSRFEADLAEKDCVVLLRDAATGEVSGFSTQKVLSAVVRGRRLRALDAELVELDSQLSQARSEAKNAFGDDTVLVERYISAAFLTSRHW